MVTVTEQEQCGDRRGSGKNQQSDDELVERDYQIRSTWDFDPDGRGLPPVGPVESFGYVAAHSILPDETWELVDADTGEVIATYEE